MHVQTYFDEVQKVAREIDVAGIERLAGELKALRERGGRLFFLGVGGSAGNCGHAVNDFRKLCGIEAYAPTDNVSELTARTNDEGWHDGVRRVARRSAAPSDKDAILVFSVGGGNLEKQRQPEHRRRAQGGQGARPQGVRRRRPRRRLHQAGRRLSWWSFRRSMPTRVTPHAEAFQAVVWHCLVSHPALQKTATKW